VRAALAVLLVWLAANIIADLDHSAVAERGLVATLLHEWSERLTLFVFVALVYSVVEAMVVTIRTASRIVSHESVGLDDSRYTLEYDRGCPAALARVTERHRVADQLLDLAESLPALPAVVVCVFVASRAPLFDAWMWSDSAVALVVGSLIAISCGLWRVRRVRRQLRDQHERDLERLGLEWRTKAGPLREQARIRRALAELRARPALAFLRGPVIGPLLGPAVTFLASLLSDTSIMEWAAGLGGLGS
jgi:hypothetical protein